MLRAAANTAVKISILHLYLMIFGHTKAFRILVYATMTIVVIFGVVSIVAESILCIPFQMRWNPRVVGKCGEILKYVIATSITNVAIDVTIFALPLPLVWRLQLATIRKIALTLVFGLGLVYVNERSLPKWLSNIELQGLWDNHHSPCHHTQIRHRRRHHLSFCTVVTSHRRRAFGGHNKCLPTILPSCLRQDIPQEATGNSHGLVEKYDFNESDQISTSIFPPL